MKMTNFARQGHQEVRVRLGRAVADSNFSEQEV